MVVCRKDLFVPSPEMIEAITHVHGAMPDEDMTLLSTFPGSWQLYGGKKTDPYFSSYMVHQSLSKVDYVYAKDLCTGLMHSISTCPFGPLESKLAISLVTYFMKTHEEKLSFFDLVPFDRQTHSRVIQAISNLNTLAEEAEVDLAQLSFRFNDIAKTAQFFTIVLLLNPVWPLMKETETDKLQDCTLEIGKLLQEFDKKVPIKNNGRVYADVAMWVSSVVTIFGRFIKENSELMASKEIENFKVPVRLFQIKNGTVTMAHELLHKLKSNGMDVSGFEDQINAMPELSTLSFRQVFEMVPRESIKKIDFITIKLSYDDVPIPLINGGYGNLWGREMMHFEEIGGEPIEESEEDQASTDLVTTSDSEVEEKPKKKKKAKTAKRKSEEPVKSEKKESESCPKCYRASLHTQKAYEKLRVDKIETKSLKKRLTEMEMENLKKDEKIRDLMMLVELQKKELEQRDEVIRNQKDQMEENQKIMETMQSQLEHKTELVEDLEAAISLAPVPENLPEESTPIRSQEQTENVRETLFTLLNAQFILQREKPIQKVLHLTNKLMAKSKKADVQKRARFETIKYREACSKYSEAVEFNLAMIRANQQITVDQIPELPAFPTLSQWFQDTYKETMKSDVPTICESLTNTPELNPDELADKECLICLDHMESEVNTTKCECCKRRYHNECIQEWFQTKRSCPTCSSGLLDDQEFPALS